MVVRVHTEFALGAITEVTCWDKHSENPQSGSGRSSEAPE